MLGHFAVNSVDTRVRPIAAVVNGRGTVVGNQQFGNAAEILIHVNMRGNPRRLLLVEESLDVGILAIAQNADENKCFRRLAGVWIGDVCGITRPIDLNLFARLPVDMHGGAALLLVLLDVIAKLGIHQRHFARQAAFLQVLRPQQLLVDAVALKLPANVCKIGHFVR